VVTQLNVSQQCALATKVANGTLGCTTRSIVRRLREVILPLPSAVAKPQQCWVQLWAPQYDRDMDILQRVQQRAMKMMKGWEHVPCEERLREL